MRIRAVVLTKQTVYKVHKKHGVKVDEIKTVLLGNPYVRNTKFERYIAIGKAQRFVTVVFECESGVAEIITAYPSAEWQIKLYKTKKER